MVNKIMSGGFGALSAYTAVFTLVSLILFVAAAIVNAFMKEQRFDIREIRKMFLESLIFTLVFSWLNYFFV